MLKIQINQTQINQSKIEQYIKKKNIDDAMKHLTYKIIGFFEYQYIY